MVFHMHTENEMVTYLSGSFLVGQNRHGKSQLSWLYILYVHVFVYTLTGMWQKQTRNRIYMYTLYYTGYLAIHPVQTACGQSNFDWRRCFRTPKGVIQEQYIYIYLEPKLTLVLIGISALFWGVWPSEIGVIGALGIYVYIYILYIIYIYIHTFFHCQTCLIVHFPAMAHVWLEMPRRRLEPRVQPQMPWIFCDQTMSGKPIWKGSQLPQSGWWLNQPIWKIWVKLGIFPKIGMKIKNGWVATT